MRPEHGTSSRWRMPQQCAVSCTRGQRPFGSIACAKAVSWQPPVWALCWLTSQPGGLYMTHQSWESSTMSGCTGHPRCSRGHCCICLFAETLRGGPALSRARPMPTNAERTGTSSSSRARPPQFAAQTVPSAALSSRAAASKSLRPSSPRRLPKAHKSPQKPCEEKSLNLATACFASARKSAGSPSPVVPNAQARFERPWVENSSILATASLATPANTRSSTTARAA
mmetsp:Transcript_60957/g.141996  ORF Transcript_60957/g.141996 Transcript_60957/m.141996 type:complete len:227 (-) Transcript_60957:1142-1822(-)